MAAEGSQPYPPVVLSDFAGGILGPCRYRIMHPIGKYFEDKFTVYKAVVIYLARNANQGLDPEDLFAAVKYMNKQNESRGCLELNTAAEKNSMIPSHNNLVQIEKPFVNGFHFCVVVPLMSMGSMRFITATKFPDGMPEDCILVVLKETLKGLKVIHDNNLVHRELHSRNILLNGKPEIKVAFAAAVFTPTEEQQLPSSSSALPFASICDWAAAPEEYQTSTSQNFRRYTAKGDVWMIGIISLELVWGGLEVSSREELELKLKKIKRKGILPKEDLDKKDKKINFRLGKSKTTNRVFSEGFEKMVASCLKKNPRKRPTVGDLLVNNLFTGLQKTVSEFYDVVKDKPVSVDVLRTT